MRRSREAAAETRRRIVEQASQFFRGRGIEAVSVADIMGSLGLTVGGFYRHFASKEALVAEALDAASLETTRDRGEGMQAMLLRYLSDEHRRQLGRGCPVAALCSEVAHQSRSTKKAFTVALERLLEVIDRVAPGAGRRKVLHAAAAVVGGLVLARASADDRLAAEILEAVRAETLSGVAARETLSG
jgi:TetR/AcrR family transcriptional regulator, transcriptional repressor for nem operon